MAMDVFFAAIGCLKELITGLASPSIMTREVHQKLEIRDLPKFIFEVVNDEEQPDVGGRMVPFETNVSDFSHEHVLLLEDVNCCICMCPYEDGTQLHLLPCNHHFHVKWLKITSTCPTCNYIIGQRVVQVCRPQFCISKCTGNIISGNISFH